MFLMSEVPLQSTEWSGSRDRGRKVEGLDWALALVGVSDFGSSLGFRA